MIVIMLSIPFLDSEVALALISSSGVHASKYPVSVFSIFHNTDSHNIVDCIYSAGLFKIEIDPIALFESSISINP